MKTDASRRITDSIFELLSARADGASICPSEVARALAPDGWRALMPEVREHARQLAIDGRLEIRQRGRSVQPNGEWRGPIRLALPADVEQGR